MSGRYDNLITGVTAKLPDIDNKSHRKHKYNAVRTQVDGIWFASGAEARRYGELKLLKEAGNITELRLQPRFTIRDAAVVDGERTRKIEYVADFSYLEDDKKIVEDVKGVETPMFVLKAKMFRARYCGDWELRIVK